MEELERKTAGDDEQREGKEFDEGVQAKVGTVLVGRELLVLRPEPVKVVAADRGES